VGPDNQRRLRQDALTIAVFVLLWVLLDRMAATLGSTRGEFGIAICIAVVAAAFGGEWLLARRSPPQLVSALGLGRSEKTALLWAIVLATALLCYFPVFSAATDTPLTIRGDAALLIPGVFAQGGVAEELVFRGFLFRRLRDGRSFWRGAGLAAIPFVAVHMLLFLTLDFPIALAALLVSLSISFPLAWLFDRAGAIWPCAIVHAVVQGAIKFIDAGPAFPQLALGWMALCAAAPWLFFLIKAKPANAAPIHA
jgi:membrane protease YdiL (CAAX protease family)